MSDLSFVDGFFVGASRAQEAKRRGESGRVFDWHKAARLISERHPREAGAGLSGDWPSTGGPIFRNGAPVPRTDTYTYLASLWAMPQIDIDGERIECAIADTPDANPGAWGAETYWPESALAILRGGDAMTAGDSRTTQPAPPKGT